VSERTVRAAGGVLWRDGDGTTEVAVVHRSRYDDWSLPKGKLERGEHPLVGACREVLEETGVRPVAGRRLPSTRYSVMADGTLAGKLVDYWSMRAEPGDFVPNDEVDGLKWTPPEDALDAVTYRHDRDVLEGFLALPVHTTTIVLVRHAKAGSRSQWPGHDGERPLDDVGRRQARRLAGILPWFGPRRVLSAAKVRCVETVRPTAEALGLEVAVDRRWDEERDEAPAVAALRDLAARGEPAVVCSQGGLIPAVLAALAEADGLDLGSTKTRKGAAWALAFDGRRLVAADHLEPDHG
jgi:8-oxo-dGTP pyrophosphatase MutT (NUDIX family)/phosphohistidine phosphatase SixA